MLISQELLAIGACNTVGSFLRCYVAAGSLSRSSVQNNAGGRTQVHTHHQLYWIFYHKYKVYQANLLYLVSVSTCWNWNASITRLPRAIIPTGAKGENAYSKTFKKTL